MEVKKAWAEMTVPEKVAEARKEYEPKPENYYLPETKEEAARAVDKLLDSELNYEKIQDQKPGTISDEDDKEEESKSSSEFQLNIDMT